MERVLEAENINSDSIDDDVCISLKGCIWALAGVE